MQINQAASEQNRVADDGGKETGATVSSGKLSSIKLPFPFLEKPLTHFFPPGALLHQPEVERSEKVGVSGTGSEAGDGLRVSSLCIKTLSNL